MEILQNIAAKYGAFYAAHVNQQLNSENVPPKLQRFIPYAQLWGVPDDGFRDQLVAIAPASAKDDLLSVLNIIDDDLDEWLAGDESELPLPSREYIAFSAMRMAALMT